MNKNSLNLGLVAALIGILLFLLIAILEPGMILLSALGIIGFIAIIVLPVIYIRKERKEQGGYITFGDAFKLSLVGLIIGGLIGTAFQMIYTNVIDPEFGERITAKTLEMSNSFMEGNVPDDQREEILRGAEADSLERYTVVGQLKSFGYAIIMYAVISLILALILKKNPEPTRETLDQ
jgi:hypothetical protein